MRLLVDTILQNAKMSTKNFSMNPQEIDLHKIIEKVIQSFAIKIDSRGGSLTCNLQANPPILWGDELHITNLVYNLIDNAVKYSTDKLDILLETRIEGDKIVLSVADHGIGISKEDQKHIFEKFYRVSTGNVHNVKGFGIGLNYVWQVVKLHNGEIAVDSTVGEGSTFTITLPKEE